MLVGNEYAYIVNQIRVPGASAMYIVIDEAGNLLEWGLCAYKMYPFSEVEPSGRFFENCAFIKVMKEFHE